MSCEEATTKRTDRKWIHEVAADELDVDGDDDDGDEVLIRRRALFKGFCWVNIYISYYWSISRVQMVTVYFLFLRVLNETKNG